MGKIKETLLKIAPLYGWLCALLLIAVNLLVFEGSRFINTGWKHYDLSLPIDKYFHLIKGFIIVYIPIAYAQWIYGFYLAAREKRPICYKIYVGEMVAKLLCLICFLVIPTTMVRNDLTDTGFLSRWIQSVYDIDPADNLFPSIHCLESYVVTRAGFSRKIGMEKCPSWFKWLNIPVTMLVFASTLLLRQHVFVDVIAAIIVAEIGLFVSIKAVDHSYEN